MSSVSYYVSCPACGGQSCCEEIDHGLRETFYSCPECGYSRRVPWDREELSRPELPPLEAAEDQGAWLEMAARAAAEQLGTPIPGDTAASLWDAARDTVAAVGDRFYDPGEFGDRCYGCHLQDAGRKGCSCGGIWYGSSPNERLANRVAAGVYAGLLLAWALGRQG
jgi:hypothetical protein